MPKYSGYPSFNPNVSPSSVFKKGSFGGTYWRSITSGVTKKTYKNQHKKYSFLNGIPDKKMTVEWKNYDKSVNKYKVKSGQTLQQWEKQGWINKSQPYGWMQWYCDFHNGKRGADDARQIKRWEQFAGPNGRFRKKLINMCKSKKAHYDNYSISPAIRQGLLHWGFELKACHLTQ